MAEQLTPHFTREEFACKCGCGFDDIDAALVSGLERLRGILAKPITILSGCRCVAHNTAVGGAKNSQHVTGKAADIRVSGVPPMTIYSDAVTVPQFRGFGVDAERNFLHVDVRLKAARWMYHQGKESPWVDAAIAPEQST